VFGACLTLTMDYNNCCRNVHMYILHTNVYKSIVEIICDTLLYKLVGQCTVHYNCSVYTVQCAVYTIQCTLCSVQCTLYNVQCAVYTMQCTMQLCSVQCTLCSVQCNCAWCSVHDAVYNATVQCAVPLCSVHCFFNN